MATSPMASPQFRAMLMDTGRREVAARMASQFLGIDLDAEIAAAERGIADVLAEEARRQGVGAQTLESVTGVGAKAWADILAGRALSLPWLVIAARLLGYRVGVTLEAVDRKAAPPLRSVAALRGESGTRAREVRRAVFGRTFSRVRRYGKP